MPTARREFLIAILACWPRGAWGRAGAEDGFRSRAAAIELSVFVSTNLQRTARRLPALDPSDRLAEVARGHSRDMLMRAYFDHLTPEGLRSADRVARVGLRFDATGENLYMASGSVSDPTELGVRMVREWMNSRAHRENILAPDFRLLGVGVALTPRIVLATQLFAG